jgi:hypothetical protein
MAFTNGTVLGQFEGNTLAGTNSAFNSSNKTNPSFQPVNDMLQVYSVGGKILLQVTGNGVVNTGNAIASPTPATTVGTIQMSLAQFNTLPGNATAAQICGVAFSGNTANLDIFQIVNSIASPAIPGGGSVIFRLSSAGVALTS